MVDDGDLGLKDALAAQDVATDDSDVVNENEAIIFAKEFTSLIGSQKAAVAKARKENPSESADTIIEAAKSGRTMQVTASLGSVAHLALKQYEETEGTNQRDAAMG